MLYDLLKQFPFRCAFSIFSIRSSKFVGFALLPFLYRLMMCCNFLVVFRRCLLFPFISLYLFYFEFVLVINVSSILSLFLLCSEFGINEFTILTSFIICFFMILYYHIFFCETIWVYPCPSFLKKEFIAYRSFPERNSSSIYSSSIFNFVGAKFPYFLRFHLSAFAT